MRKMTILGMAAVAMLMMTSVVVAAGKAAKPATPAAPAAAAAPTDPAVSAFQQSKDFQKLGADTQQAWQDAMKQGPDTRMDVIVRVDPPYDAGDRSFLENHGMVVQMASGTLVRGHLPAQAMPSVASIPFVRSVGMAK